MKLGLSVAIICTLLSNFASAKRNMTEGDYNFWWERRQPLTKLVLDDISDYWGEGKFSNEYYGRLQKCFRKWGDNDMEEASDAFWRGII